MSTPQQSHQDIPVNVLERLAESLLRDGHPDMADCVMDYTKKREG